MSFSERSIVAELVTSLIVIALFTWLLVSRMEAGAFDGPEGLQAWARQVLWMIPVGIGTGIGVTLLLAMAHHASAREAFDGLVDERDRLITLWGWKVTAITVSAGFIAALGALAWGLTPLFAMNLMLASFALGDVAGNLAKMLRYRRGY
jgi:hypothetical protein